MSVLTIEGDLLTPDCQLDHVAPLCQITPPTEHSDSLCSGLLRLGQVCSALRSFPMSWQNPKSPSLSPGNKKNPENLGPLPS